VPTEMLACGLPVVDVASDAMQATFGPAGPVLLAEPDPLALCAAIERLLDDLVERADRSRAGTELVAARTWAAAAEQVERGLRAALSAAGL
jgi:O-antigen biosynthesis protein